MLKSPWRRPKADPTLGDVVAEQMGREIYAAIDKAFRAEVALSGDALVKQVTSAICTNLVEAAASSQIPPDVVARDLLRYARGIAACMLFLAQGMRDEGTFTPECDAQHFGKAMKPLLDKLEEEISK